MQTDDSIKISLSRRESEVLGLLLCGMSNKEIAARLGIYKKTVEKHLTNIYIKIGVTSRTEAVLWGIERRQGFLSLQNLGSVLP